MAQNSIEQLLRPITDRLIGLSRATQIALVAGVLTVVGIGTLMSKGGEVTAGSYLFTGLDARDAGDIVQKLKERRVAFKIENGGSAIMVPEAQVHELRLELAQSGLPKGGGVGFEIFDRPSYGQSDFVQQKNYARALQGELERTVSAIAAVQAARVHLVLPERRLFRDNEEPASASVVVKLRPGRTLSEGQAQGVVHLVASSVAGLTPERVTLLDDSGQVLSEAGDRLGAMATSGLDYKRKIERGYEQKIRSIVERAVGVGKASVQVSAEVDFSQLERTEESYDPERTVLRSEQSNEETSASKEGSGARGVPGTQSNLPGAQADAAAALPAAPGASNQRRSQTKNYEIAKTTSRTVAAPGKLSRLTVAVLVDGVYEGTARTFAPRPDEQIEALSAVVKQAMGYDLRRGDQIELRCVPFATEELAPVETPSPVTVFLQQAPAPAWLSLAASVLIGMMLLVLILRRRQAPLMPALMPGLPRTVREVEALVASGEQGHMGLPAAGQDRGASPRDVQAMVMQDTGRAATVLHSWLQPQAGAATKKPVEAKQ